MTVTVTQPVTQHAGGLAPGQGHTQSTKHSADAQQLPVHRTWPRGCGWLLTLLRLCSTPWRRSLPSRSQGSAAWGHSGGRSFLVLPAPGAVQPLACGCIAPSSESSFGLFLPSPPSPPQLPSDEDTVLGFRAHPDDPGWPHLQALRCICKDLFPNRPHTGRRWTHFWG